MKILNAFIRIVAPACLQAWKRLEAIRSLRLPAGRQERMTSGFLYETHPRNKTRHDPHL